MKVWELARRRVLHTFRGQSSGVLALAFSPDGKLLASAGRDRLVRLWEVGS